MKHIMRPLAVSSAIIAAVALTSHHAHSVEPKPFAGYQPYVIPSRSGDRPTEDQMHTRLTTGYFANPNRKNRMLHHGLLPSPERRLQNLADISLPEAKKEDVKTWGPIKNYSGLASEYKWLAPERMKRKGGYPQYGVQFLTWDVDFTVKRAKSFVYGWQQGNYIEKGPLAIGGSVGISFEGKVKVKYGDKQFSTSPFWEWRPFDHDLFRFTTKSWYFDLDTGSLFGEVKTNASLRGGYNYIRNVSVYRSGHRLSASGTFSATGKLGVTADAGVREKEVYIDSVTRLPALVYDKPTKFWVKVEADLFVSCDFGTVGWAGIWSKYVNAAGYASGQDRNYDSTFTYSALRSWVGGEVAVEIGKRKYKIYAQREFAQPYGGVLKHSVRDGRIIGDG